MLLNFGKSLSAIFASPNPCRSCGFLRPPDAAAVAWI
jgi:hypothetical protein